MGEVERLSDLLLADLVCFVFVQEEPAGRQTESPRHNAAPGGGPGAGSLGHLLPGWTHLQGHVPGVSLHRRAEQRQRHSLVRGRP